MRLALTERMILSPAFKKRSLAVLHRQTQAEIWQLGSTFQAETIRCMIRQRMQLLFQTILKCESFLILQVTSKRFFRGVMESYILLVYFYEEISNTPYLISTMLNR